MSARHMGKFDCSPAGWGFIRDIRTTFGEDVALLWLWFQGNSYSHFTGLYNFVPAMAVRDTGMSEEEVVDAMNFLIGTGRVEWDSEAQVIYIPCAMDGGANLNKAKPSAKRENQSRTHAITHMLGLAASPLVEKFCKIHNLESPHKTEVRVGMDRDPAKNPHGMGDGMGDESLVEDTSGLWIAGGEG